MSEIIKEKIISCNYYSMLDFDKHRFYQCKKEWNGTYSCKKINKNDSPNLGTELLFVSNQIPEIKLFDEILLKYKLIPSVNILDKKT